MLSQPAAGPPAQRLGARARVRASCAAAWHAATAVARRACLAHSRRRIHARTRRCGLRPRATRAATRSPSLPDCRGSAHSGAALRPGAGSGAPDTSPVVVSALSAGEDLEAAAKGRAEGFGAKGRQPLRAPLARADRARRSRPPARGPGPRSLHPEGVGLIHRRVHQGGALGAKAGGRVGCAVVAGRRAPRRRAELCRRSPAWPGEVGCHHA